MKVRAKKHLGQHFLRDQDIAQRIVASLVPHQDYTKVLEIGPGMGVLTQYLLPNPNFETHVIEVDRESVAYLKLHYPRSPHHRRRFSALAAFPTHRRTGGYHR